MSPDRKDEDVGQENQLNSQENNSKNANPLVNCVHVVPKPLYQHVTLVKWLIMAPN